MELIFASHNQHKVSEIKKLLPDTISLFSLTDINYTTEIEETELTLEGNALLKAKAIYRIKNTNCFADDSGLLVDVLNGEPGVFSARYAGEQKNDQDNIEKLLVNLNGVANRSAHFKTVMALIIDGKEYCFEGIIEGKIITEKKGLNGFGYDSVFVPNGYNQTFAEMDSTTKNAISHRGIALAKLIAFLKLS